VRECSGYPFLPLFRGKKDRNETPDPTIGRGTPKKNKIN